MIARDQVFSNMRIVVDGSSFYGCTFRSCVFVYCATLPAVLEGCTYDKDCKWELERAAKHTLDFMATLYRSGAHQVVENTFDLIRGRPPGGTRLM